jgi:hypothetical protein
MAYGYTYAYGIKVNGVTGGAPAGGIGTMIIGSTFIVG